MFEEELLADILDIKQVQHFLERGANPDHTDKLGRSLLMLAAQYHHLDICKLLIQAGAKPNYLDKHNRTVLFYAVEDSIWSDNKVCTAESVVDYFLSLGVPTNQIDDKGMTALEYAFRQSTHAGASAILYAQLKSVLPLDVRYEIVAKYRSRLLVHDFNRFLKWKRAGISTDNYLAQVHFLKDLVSEQEGKPDSPLSLFVHQTPGYAEYFKKELRILLEKEEVKKVLEEEQNTKNTVFHSYASSSSSSSSPNTTNIELLKHIENLEKRVTKLEDIINNTNTNANTNANKYYTSTI